MNKTFPLRLLYVVWTNWLFRSQNFPHSNCTFRTHFNQLMTPNHNSGTVLAHFATYLGPNRWWKSGKSSFEENTPKTQHVPSFSQSKLFYERNMNEHTQEGPPIILDGIEGAFHDSKRSACWWLCFVGTIRAV